MQMLELSERDYKIIIITVEKMDHMCKEMINFSRVMETGKKALKTWKCKMLSKMKTSLDNLI